MVIPFSHVLSGMLVIMAVNGLSAAPPAAPAQALPCGSKMSARPVGVWVRDVGPVKVVMKITADRLTSTAIFATDSKASPRVKVTLDADYAVAKDGTLFGVAYGADATQPMYAAIFQPVAGHPFAFGWRVDEDTLTLRDLKWLGSGLHADKASEFDQLPVLANGRYTRMDEAKIPEWEKQLTGTPTPLMKTVHGKCDAPASMTLTPPPELQPPSNGTPYSPAPAPAEQVSGYTYPSGVFLIPHSSLKPPALPVAPAAPTQTAPVPNPLPGTWSRDVGACQVALTITPTHLIARITLDQSGKSDLLGVVFTADYHLEVDGKTVRGKITGTDVRTSKSIGFFEAKKYRQMARDLDNRILAFEFRESEGFLSISNVGPLQDRENAEDPLAAFAGVYTRETETNSVPPAVSKSGPAVEPHPPLTNSGTSRERDSMIDPNLRLESSDILLIDVLKSVPKPDYQLEPLDEVICLQLSDPVLMNPRQDTLTIDPNGAIDLGTARGGRVKIAGLTVAEAKQAVEKTLAAAQVNDTKLTIHLARFHGVQQIKGQHLVRPDGTIGFGRYGSVSVSGKSLADAKTAIEKHLSQYLLDLELSLDMEGFNSKHRARESAVSVVPAPVNPLQVNPIQGTWLQEKDGMQWVLKFAEKRLNVEINGAFELPGEKGSPIRFTQSLDADYSTSPDGTVYGVLTGMDVTLGEGFPPEAYASLKDARQQYQRMIGAMFKFRTRMDGGRMTLSEARASLFDSRGPAGEEKSDTSAVVGEIFAGRFERVTGMVPPPKPRAGGFIHQYSADPDVRIEQLQKEKDELRQQGDESRQQVDEWRKFWNNDMPNQIPAPKCKECAPPLKLEPNQNGPIKNGPIKSGPIPPTPMSRG